MRPHQVAQLVEQLLVVGGGHGADIAAGRDHVHQRVRGKLMHPPDVAPLERPERRADRRPLIRRPFFQPLDRAVPGMGENKAAEIGISTASRIVAAASSGMPNKVNGAGCAVS